MATLATILRLDKLNKKGEAPIYFRIIKHRKVSYISTSVRIAPKYWNKNKQVVKANHKNCKRLNSYLSNTFAELQDKIFQFETVSKSFTTAMLKEEVHGKEPIEFNVIAQRDIDRLWKSGKIGTMDKRKSVLKKLDAYLGKKKLYFQNIDLKFLYTYEDWLRNIRKNSINTIHKDMKYIKTIFNIAIREQLVDPSTNPFLLYKLRTEKTQKSFLSEEELSRIEKCELEEYSLYDMHRDMFIFSAYTGGLRISDVLTLEHSNIEEKHININIRKTGSNLSILLPKKSWAIINKWKSSPTPSTKFIFPLLPDRLNFLDGSSENSLKIDKLIASKSAAINRSLKIIAKKAKITKTLSTHIARHTWATRALRKGISIDKVSKLMGHAQIRETQIYAKIVNTELDKAMTVFDE